MPSLVMVPLSEVRREWAVVRPMVEAVRERCPSNWIADDVYAAIQSQMALLHIAHDDDGHVCGCLVTQRKDDWGEPHLFVWICFHRHADKTIADYWPEVLGLAKALGLKKVRCESPRSYERSIPMKPLYSVYEGVVE